MGTARLELGFSLEPMLIFPAQTPPVVLPDEVCANGNFIWGGCIVFVCHEKIGLTTASHRFLNHRMKSKDADSGINPTAQDGSMVRAPAPISNPIVKK